MMDHSLSCRRRDVYAVPDRKKSREKKPKASYFYCVYMEITSLSCVYQFIITTAECKRKRIFQTKAADEKEEEYVIDLTIKPLNGRDNDTKHWMTMHGVKNA